MLPKHPKTMWPVAEDTVRSPDVSAWKSALCDSLRSADGFHVLSMGGTMKIAMGVRRRDAGTPLTPGSPQQDNVDHNTYELTTRTLQRAVMDLAVVPSDWRTRCSPTMWEVCAGQSLTPHHRRCTPHLPMKYEAVPRIPVLQAPDATSACQQVQSVLTIRGPPGRGRTRTLWRRAREHIDAAVTSMKSAEVWSGLAEWIRALAAVATLHPEGMKNKHSQKEMFKLRLLMVVVTFQGQQWCLNNTRLR